jgi:hypothetical protein
MASNAARIMTNADEDAAEIAGQIGADPAAAREPALTPVRPGPIRQPEPTAAEPQLVAVEVDEKGNRIGEPVQAAEPAEPNEELEEPLGEGEGEGGQPEGEPVAGQPQQPLSNRGRRRQIQKAAKERTIQENDRLRRELVGVRGELAAVKTQLGAFEPRLAQIGDVQRSAQLTNLTNEIERVNQTLAGAENKMLEAMTAGDNPAFIKALHDRDELRIQKFRLDATKDQLIAAAKVAQRQQPTMVAPADGGATAQPQPQRTLAPAAQAYVDDFQDRYADWFDPTGKDRDSRMVYLLDKEVADAGFDPSTPAYWDEMDTLMRQYLPHRFQEANAATPRPTPAPRQNGGARVQPQAAAPVRRGPPIAGPSNRAPMGARPGEVHINPARKQAMIDANILHADGSVADKVRFKRVLQQYADFDSREGAAR